MEQAMTAARCPLVREIEAPAGAMQSPSDVHAFITRKYIRESPFWPRLRAALEAAEEMAEYAEKVTDAPGLWMAAKRYRAATRTEVKE